MSKRASTSKRRPARKRLATFDDYAKADFKPWKRPKHMKPGELVPSNELLLKHGVAARAAYAIMLKTRAELIAMHAEADHEIVNVLMKEIRSSSEAFGQLVAMLDPAYSRVIASGAAHEKAGGKFKRAA